MKQEFKDDFAEALEVDAGELNPDYVLEDSEMWDSMTIVTVIALIDEHYGKTVGGEELSECKTVGDVERLIGEN